MHLFLHFKSFCLVVLQFILASKLSELEQFENQEANCQFSSKYEYSGKWLHPRGKSKKGDPPNVSCILLKLDLVHLNGPQTKFIFDSLYKYPVAMVFLILNMILLFNYQNLHLHLSQKNKEC